MPSDLVTLAGANDTLEAYLRPPRRWRNPVYLCAVVAAVAALLALPLISVDVGLTAAGLVRPTLEKREIRIPISGRVEELFIRDNQLVSAGQPLVRLESAETREQLAAVGFRLRNLEEWTRDLRMLAGAGVNAASPSSTRFRAELAQLRGAVEPLRIRAGGLRSQLARSETLFRGQMASESEVEALRTQLLEAEATADGLVREHRARWEAELSQMENERRELALQRDRMQRTEQKHLLVSPLAGTLEQLAPVTDGGMLTEGERFAVISPASRVIVEAYVAPHQVGLIRKGMPVRLQVDAYRSADWGYLDGEVIDIADDFFQSGDRPVFVIRCALRGDRLTLPNGAVGHLRKGMTVRAHFVLARRSLFQLLRDRADDWLDPRQFR